MRIFFFLTVKFWIICVIFGPLVKCGIVLKLVLYFCLETFWGLPNVSRSVHQRVKYEIPPDKVRLNESDYNFIVVWIGSQLDHSMGKITFILTIFRSRNAGQYKEKWSRAIKNHGWLQQFSLSLQTIHNFGYPKVSLPRFESSQNGSERRFEEHQKGCISPRRI